MKYYTVKFYTEPPAMNNEHLNIVNMADDLCEMLALSYDTLEYSVTDLEEDVTVSTWHGQNTAENRKAFSDSLYSAFSENNNRWIRNRFFWVEFSYNQGKKDDFAYPLFTIHADYPVSGNGYLDITICFESGLISELFSLEDFGQMHSILRCNGYLINSAVVHYQGGDIQGIMKLTGIEYGPMSVTDWQIIEHVINYRENWKNKIVYPLLMNSINKTTVSKETTSSIRRIVGDGNMIETEDDLLFQGFHSLSKYRLGRILPSIKRGRLKRLLLKENLMDKDTAWLMYLLDVI